MAKEKTEDILLSIQVPVSVQELNYLEANAGSKTPGEKLASYTSWFIKRQARGGVMIEPQDMDYIASLNAGKRFETSRDVVKAMESALNRDDGGYSYTVKVAPEYKDSLEVQAQYQNCTVEELLSGLGNEIMSNGWWQDFVPAQGRLIPLDEIGLGVAQRVLGKYTFSGVDIKNALERLEKFEKDQGAKVAKVA